MKLTSITLQNFRCFGPEKVTIELDDLTAFVGSNGVGKTAVLVALARLFGTNPTMRDLQIEDFHLPPGEVVEDAEERKLMVEVRIDFPELGDTTANAATVPPSFSKMVVGGQGGPVYCRIRLVGTLTQTQLEAGDISQQLNWVTSTEPEPASKDAFQRVEPMDRARIQVFYVPGSRDASKQLANVSGTLLNQLLKAIKWDPDIKKDLRAKAEEVRDTFVKLAPVTLINKTSGEYWRALYDEEVYSEPSLAFMGSDFNDIIKDTRMVFNPTHGTGDHGMERLSDGQQSLFYFAFINTLFSIRRQVFDEHHAPADEPGPAMTTPEMPAEASVGVELAAPPSTKLTDHISYENLRPAPLTIFAIEEPENHLAPHCLARIMKQLEAISADQGAQVIVTSHCPPILSRVSPEYVRYFRIERPSMQCKPQRILLPTDQGEAFKYVKQAVRAYPELYFSRLVILGEGDSEEFLLKQFAMLSGSPLDTAFVSVVPLGGRFVSHLWRLLSDLKIPFLTLLDLDQERRTGGWKTIQYVLNELGQVLGPNEKAKLLEIKDNNGIREMTQQEIDKLHEQKPDVAQFEAWAARLEEFGVYLSAPLDVDFTMLQAYPEKYKEVYPGEPRGITGDGKAERIEKAVTAVLGADGGDGSSFTADQKELFPWYSYIFLGKGKPTSHALAWLNEEILDPTTLPEPLNRLFQRVRLVGSET